MSSSAKTSSKSPGKKSGDRVASKSGKKKDGVEPGTSSKRSKKDADAAAAASIKSSLKKTDVPGQRKPAEKRNKRQNELKKAKDKPEKKKKPVRKNKTLYEKIALSFGYYMGPLNITDPYALEAVQALNLSTWDLRKLKARFDAIDLDGSGAIDYDEFFEAVGEVRSPFTDKLFSLIDLDGSGTIEFDEYVRVMATYCMFTKDEVLRFCFECFDVDRSGTIDEKEFVELCRCINNASPAFPNNFKKALEEFDVNEDGLIDYSEFIAIDVRYPLILFPAFRLQDVMQRASLGESAWLAVIERYENNKRIEEYKASHGGRAPPDPAWKVVLKTLAPCFFREKVHIVMGKEMDDRHRGEA